MKISQETYDETLLENEEVFSLSPEEAVEETISQFKQQNIIDLGSYIVTSHPLSTEGKEERAVRSNFVSLLNKLDSFIKSDGTVAFCGPTSTSLSTAGGDAENENGDNAHVSSVIVDTIEEIHGYCRRGTPKKVSEGNNDTSNDDDNTESVYYNKPVPFLTLAHSTSSLYTFMNLLSVIEFPKVTNNGERTGESESLPSESDEIPIPTKEQTRVLQSALKLLITLLCPKNKNEKDIKMMFKDAFVCMDRMVGLIAMYMTLVKQYEGKEGENGELYDDEIITFLETTILVIQCIMYACKNCERNKVSFVRCLKAYNVSKSIEFLVEKMFDTLRGNNNDKASPRVEGGETVSKKKKESTIGIISFVMNLTLELYQSSSSSSSVSKRETMSSSLVILMTECCKLISVLCRYDDFRTAEATNGTNNHASMVDSSYGGVSSAHDHVLEFNREGVIPTLHELILLSLDQQHSSDGNDWDTYAVGLAAAAMSATRVLAVNDEIVQALVAVGILKSIKVALDMGVVQTGEEEVTDKIESTDIDDDNNDSEGDVLEEDENNGNVATTNDGNKDMNQTNIHIKRQQLASGAIGLVRNLCGNDEIKTTLCLGSSASNTSNNLTAMAAPSILPSIIQGMNIYKKNASIQEHGCGTLAAMALRKPSNSLRILHEDGASSILTAMKLFPNNVLVQRQGALAVRNIVSRLVANTSAVEALKDSEKKSKDECDSEAQGGGFEGTNDNCNDINVRDIFLDLGAEVILRGITGRHQGSVDEAYAALRDLGCPVSMVKYDAEKQTTTSRTVMFGDIDVKSSFRPVYEESS